MIKQVLKAVLPAPVRARLVLLRKFLRYSWRRIALRRAVQRNEAVKIIIGAAETSQEGWYATNEQWLDTTSREDWARIFSGRPLIKNVVAEHVFEHLTQDGAEQALHLIAAHMPANGRIRIAVPDGYHPDPEYIRHVGIGGIGDDAADHKQLLNVDSLTALLQGADFKAEHIEGYNRDGTLVQKAWKAEDGFVRRSRQIGHPDTWDFPDADTSLIVDGIRQ